MRRFLTLLVGVALLFSAGLVSRTLAGSITLGAGSVEFGQGILLVTNCDPNIFAQPIPKSVSGVYYLDGIEFSDVDVAECDNREFTVKAFQSGTRLDFASGISEIKVGLYGGFFYSLTSGIRLESGDNKGWFSVQVENSPAILSANLNRLTLESQRATDLAPCNVTPTTNGAELTYTFTSVGVCVFTAQHSKVGATAVLVAGGGGGGGGAAVDSNFDGFGGGGGGGGGGEVIVASINLDANAKFLISVGAGGSGGAGSSTIGIVGKNGYSTAGFGARARPGFGGGGGASNLDEDGINITSCSGASTEGTGGIGGNSGNTNAGGAKPCSFAGGGGGGGSFGVGSSSSSTTGANGGAGTVAPTGTYGVGGRGGAGGSDTSPSSPSPAASYGDGGGGGGGSKGGTGANGGAGSQGVVILRYTPS